MKAIMLLSIISILPLNTVSKQSVWYGRVFESGIYFYSSPQDNEESKMFLIEPSYFVELTQEFNSVFYSAQYMGISGFVKKKDVQATSSNIKKPFLDYVCFRVYLTESQTMYSNPSSNSEVIKQIPIYTKTVKYIGKINGQTLISERTNEWYFCSYTSDKTYYGYVYSEGIDQISNIYKNTEECEYVEFPDFSAHITNLTILPQDSNNYNAIVLLVCLAMGIFVLLIAKSGSILRSKKQKNKEVTNFLDN